MIRLAGRLGSDVCFANPGTTELQFVEALDSVEGVRPVLGLHEGICTGAADGWARLTGRVGLSLLHLGVGLTNGLANLHNARRAHTPLVSIVGDHPSWHLANDPPLASDLRGLAGAGTSHSVVSSDFATAHDAFSAAWESAGRSGAPVALIVRADDAERVEPSVAGIDALPLCGGVIRNNHDVESTEVLAKLARAINPAILLGGTALGAEGKRAAYMLSRRFDITVYAESFPAIDHTGRGLPHFGPVTTGSAQTAKALIGTHDLVVLIGASDPVAFFADNPAYGRLRPDTTEVVLASDARRAEALLCELCDGINQPERGSPGDPSTTEVLPAIDGRLSSLVMASNLIELQPEGVVVIDEGNTAGGAYRTLAHRAAPHIRLSSTAGSLGFGMAAAIGAAIAEPHRRVISLQSDGAAAYTPQALWTQAREQLDITTVLLDNGGYETVRRGWRTSGGSATSSTATRLAELAGPALDWVRISEGFGVSATRVRDAIAFRGALREAFTTSGPRVVVVDIPRDDPYG